jgi:hypothetical protein
MTSNLGRYTGRPGPYAICWSATVAAMSVAFLTGGQWFPAAWTAAVLVAPWSWTFVSVTLDAAGTLEFRGLVRRERRHVLQLRSVDRGNLGLVFRFSRGRVGLLPLRHNDLETLVTQLKDLNPSIRGGVR